MAQVYTAIHQRACTDMAVISHLGIVLNESPCVDDAVCSHSRSGIHDRPVANDGASTQPGVAADNSMGGNQHRRFEVELIQMRCQPLTLSWIGKLANGQNSSCADGSEGRKISICADHWIPKSVGAHLMRQADQALDLPLTFGFNQINH